MLIFHTLIAPDTENLWDFPLSNSTGHTTYIPVIRNAARCCNESSSRLVLYHKLRLEIVKVKMARVFYELVVVFLDHLYSVEAGQLSPVGKAAYEVVQVPASAEVLLFSF